MAQSPLYLSSFSFFQNSIVTEKKRNKKRNNADILFFGFVCETWGLKYYIYDYTQWESYNKMPTEEKQLRWPSREKLTE